MTTTTSSLLTSGAAIAAALAVSVAGALFYNLLPLFLGVAQDARQLTTSQIGLVSAAFFLGYNALAGTAFYWIRRCSWRGVSAVATPTALLALGLSTQLQSYGALLLCAFVAGAAFSALYGIGATAVGDTSSPTRWYGIKISLEGAMGALLFLVLPGTWVAQYGFDGLISGMIVATLALVPFFFWLPAQGAKQTEADAKSTLATGVAEPKSNSRVWLALIGTLLFFGGQTTIWAFVERMGNSSGFAATDVGMLLSVALVFALSGSLVAAAIGGCFGNTKPFVCACLLFLAALLLLTGYQSFWYYAAGSCMVMFSVGIGITYAVSEVARLDDDGRFIVLSVPAIGIGAMLGPAIAGYLAQNGGFAMVLTFGALTVGTAIPLLLIASREPTVLAPAT